MSLILEALKKLDREKNVPQRGFVVMAPVAWPSSPRRVGLWLVVGALGLVACVSAAAWWLLGATPRATATAAAVTTPTPAPPSSPVRTAVAPAAAFVEPTAPVPVPAPESSEPASPAVLTAPSPTAAEPAPAFPASTIPAPPIPAPAVRAPAVRAPATPTAVPRPSSSRPPAPAPPAAEPAAGPPGRSEAAAADRVQLQAISQQDGVPVAVVNDRLVREGDSFDGIRVVRIGAAEVEIEVRGRRRIVRF